MPKQEFKSTMSRSRANRGGPNKASAGRGGHRGGGSGSGGKTNNEPNPTLKKQKATEGTLDYIPKETLLDEQFEFPIVDQNWKFEQNCKILGIDYITKEPLNKLVTPNPMQVDFELEDFDEYWTLGPNTKFHFVCQFQAKNAATAEIPDPPWVRCPTAEGSLVVVQPNWQEHVLKSIELLHGQAKINTSADIKHVTPYLNTFLYNYMNKEQKKLLCVEDCHPGNGTPDVPGDWTTTPNSKWLKYSTQIFAERNISFSVMPFHFGPFFQGSNYMEFPQKVLPMPLLNKIMVRFLFNENINTIFKNAAGNAKEYRVIFEKMTFTIERTRLVNSFKNDLSLTGHWDYPGVTRIMRYEIINPTDLVYKAKHQALYMPEGLFIFALPQKVMTSEDKYLDSDEPGNVFLKHNLKTVDVRYGDLPYFMFTPNLGQFNRPEIEYKIYNDYLTSAPFGLKMDSDKINLNILKDGAEKSCYPHVFINFCNYKDKSRIVPFMNNGDILCKPNDIDLTLYFKDGGATADAVYICCYYYTDKNITINTMTKNEPRCESMYIKMI